MAQVSMTVRMDAELKQMFDALCREIGMSANTAMNVFARQMVNFGGIPFEIKSKRKDDEVYERGVQAFRNIRTMAESGQLPDLSLDEINEEIRLAREERKHKKVHA